MSVVAEESSEGNSLAHSEDATSSIPINDLSAFLNKADSLSFSYLQKLTPLSHFENLPYDRIGDSVGKRALTFIHFKITFSPNYMQLTDLQGNILPTRRAPEPILLYQQNVHAMSQKQPENVIAQPTEEQAPLPIVKKESRLKHFFSPIRKKIAPPPPLPPPSSMLSLQPDLFISNVLPNNMVIQQQPQLKSAEDNNNVTTHSDQHNSSTNTTSTLSSFQVCRIF